MDDTTRHKTIIFVIGQESSGSRLVAKACAAAHGIVPFGDWNAIGWVHGERVSVCHRSLPFGTPPHFPDIDRWRRKYGADGNLRFVLTTRDVNLSDISKIETFGKSSQTVHAERDKARGIYTEVIEGDEPHFIFSYETLMFLGELYWRELYRFLGIARDRQVYPELVDANAKRIAEMHVPQEVPARYGVRAKRLVRGSVGRMLDRLKGEAD